MKRIAAGLLSSIYVLAASTAVHAGDISQWSNPDCAPNRPPALDLSLRADFNDLSPLVCPDLNQQQIIGATVSAADNLLTNKQSGSIDGLAALTWKIYGSIGSTFSGLSTGFYVQANDTYQFQSAASTNSDSATYGAFTQLVLNNSLVLGYDAFRVRGGQATGSSGTNYKTFVGEWIPVYNLGSPISFGIRLPVGNLPLYYLLQPELMVQYDQFDSGPNKLLIFSTSNQSMRIGPQLVAQFGFNRDVFSSNVNSSVADFLAATFATVTYHVSADVYSGREYSWTSVALSHSFNSYVGVTASFGSGSSEGTGNLTRQAKVGLSVKY